MRHTLTKEEYDLAWSGDLAEAFETMVQQRYYFEVLVLNGRDKGDELIGRVEKFADNAGLYNGSHYWDRVTMPVSDKHPNGYRYERDVAEEEGLITFEYFAYDSLEDAIAHNTELLMNIKVII